MIWRRVLGVRVDDIDVMYYDQLKTHVLQHELLVDSLVYKDIKLTATNDDQYFVFEDYLYQVRSSLLPGQRSHGRSTFRGHTSACTDPHEVNILNHIH